MARFRLVINYVVNLICVECTYNKKAYRSFLHENSHKCPKCNKALVNIGSVIEVPRKQKRKKFNTFIESLVKQHNEKGFSRPGLCASYDYLRPRIKKSKRNGQAT